MDKIDYASSGVNIKKGDIASRAAYQNAKKTFASRKGKIGEPFVLEGGFSGALDFGDFLVVQNDDGVGTKSEIAERLNKFDTIGEDLLCTVADDAICVGAEMISITNTADVPIVNPEILDQMTASLAKACIEQQVVIPGGEIAELGTAVNKIVWNATAVGIVKKDKFITGKNVHDGQKIVGLKGRVLRSNGISLARKICEVNFGDNWHEAEWQDGITWGEILLTPCKIFHRLLLDNILGDFDGKRRFSVDGIVHITGGGVPGNVPRILPAGLGATFNNLHTPHQAIQDLQKLGNVDEEECYKTWHCGTAMLLFSDQAEEICAVLNTVDSEVQAQIVGEVTNKGKIEITSKFSGKKLLF